MGVAELWLSRHGESTANVAATHAERQGLDRIAIDVRDADVPLSEAGQEQARALGRWLAENGRAIDAFWVSPYTRARQTLDIALAEAARPAVVRSDERLRDRELGILDLLTARGVALHHPAEAERRRRLGKFYHRPPGGESWADVALRLRSFLDGALDGPDSSAMIVAHDAVVMLLLYLLLPLEEAELLAFAETHTVLNASVTHIVRRDGAWQLVDFAAVDHLQSEGAPVTVHPGRRDAEPE